MIGSLTRRLGIVAGAALLVVLAAAAGVGGWALTRSGSGSSAPSRTPAAGPTVLAAAGAAPASPSTTTASAPSAAGVTRALRTVAGAAGLGGRLTASVLDATTGAELYQRTPTTPVAPASTAKLLTAAAVLTVHAGSDRFTTRVLAGPGSAVTVVGGGDPTLTAAPAGSAGYYRGAARISDLAAQLTKAGVRPSRIVVDDSLFTAPTVSPAWAAEDVPSSYASPITSLMVDGGRDTPSSGILSASPDLAAGRALAAAWRLPAIPVTRGTAARGAAQLATVRSAPVSALVDQMLTFSDNVIAETLGRQVALARSGTASFVGAARAIRQVLTGLGVDPGAGMVDASGLAARDRLSASTLARLLRLVSGDGAAAARLHDLVDGLPVAGWSGTLADRYLGSSAAGAVRAKTGTLTGVSTLAGLVRDRSGRLLVFALMADRAGSTADADAALDAIAAALAGCGCS